MSNCTNGGMWGEDANKQLIQFYKNNLVGVSGQDIIATLKMSDLNIPYTSLQRYTILLEKGAENISLFSQDYGITLIALVINYSSKDKEEHILQYRYNGSDTNLYLNKILLVNSISDYYVPNIFFTNISTTDDITVEVLIAYDENKEVDNGICGCDDTEIKVNEIRELKSALKHKLEIDYSKVSDNMETITLDQRNNEVLDNDVFYYQIDFGSGIYLKKDDIWYFTGNPIRGKSLSNNYSLIFDDIGYSLVTTGNINLNIPDNVFSDYHIIKLVNPGIIQMNIITNYDLFTLYDMSNLGSGVYYMEFQNNKIYVY